jgi:hypothetical protein
VVLDDVPDVSEKHLASAQPIGDDDIAVEIDDIDDDIPTPVPSHGSRSRELPSQTAAALSFPPVLEGPLPGGSGSNPPRSRRGTEPGHTPAPTSNRPSGRIHAVTLESAADQTMEDMPAVTADAAAGPKQPTIRFKAPTIQPSVQTSPPITDPVVIPLGQPVKPVRTKPGYSPAKAATAVTTEEAPKITSQRLRPKTSSPPPIGSAVLARDHKKDPRKWWVLVAGIIAAGVCATAITLYVTRGQDTVEAVREEPAPRVAPRTVGTVKFTTEPADVQITIDGKLAHTGSPWVTELGAGVHQLQIEAKDHKAWLTSLELSAAETQTLRVVLEPLGTASMIADATLILRTTPSGLDALLDGKLLQAKTPIKMPLAVGPHSIVIQQGGVEVWRQDVVAKASTNYEFSPVMDAEHQRERERADPRKQRPAQVRPTAPGANVPEAKEADAPPVAPAPPPVEEPKVVPPAPVPAPAAAPKLAQPAKPAVVEPAPVPAPPPAPAPTAARGPITVPPSAVTKVSGNPPQIGKTKNADMPAVVAAKVCIDTAGRVTSADMLTKIERRSAADLVDAIRTWQYAPYKQSGVPTPACFAISFRVK